MGATRKPILTAEATANEPVPIVAGETFRSAHSSRQPAERQCAATRQVRPTDELVRFVAGPEDRIYPDLGRKLPGRGVWITADRSSIEEAVKSRAFSRGLKCKTAVPDDLVDIVERLFERRVVDALCLAKKAGNVVTGFDKVAALIERGRAVALIHATDAATGGIEKLDRKMKFCERAGSGRAGEILSECLTIDQMSLAIGRSNVVHAGLSKGGATARFVTEACRLVEFRMGVGTRASNEDAELADVRHEELKSEPKSGVSGQG